MTPEGQCNHDLALSLHALGLVPRVEGRAAGSKRASTSSARGWRTGQAKTALSAALGRFFGSAVLQRLLADFSLQGRDQRKALLQERIDGKRPAERGQRRAWLALGDADETDARQ